MDFTPSGWLASALWQQSVSTRWAGTRRYEAPTPNGAVIAPAACAAKLRNPALQEKLQACRNMAKLTRSLSFPIRDTNLMYDALPRSPGFGLKVEGLGGGEGDQQADPEWLES